MKHMVARSRPPFEEALGNLEAFIADIHLVIYNRCFAVGIGFGIIAKPLSGRVPWQIGPPSIKKAREPNANDSQAHYVDYPSCW